jgi:TIR domain
MEGVVFISYGSPDDEPPPDRADKKGFVSHLVLQVLYDLRQRGVPDTVLWRDRAQIRKGEDWKKALHDVLGKVQLFVAILSGNYINSPWCEAELRFMEERIKALGVPPDRIFRVDKHKVLETIIPYSLRRIQAVRFYGEDYETKRPYDYFYRGEVLRSFEYYEAVKELAEAIRERLDGLGINGARLPQASPRNYNTPVSTGRVVFVAKPASDMVEAYRKLVFELRGSGFRVVPDPDKEFGITADDVQPIITSSLAEAETSIHLLGQRRGVRLEGSNEDLVPMQLMAAADEVQKREQEFARLIWAPIVLHRTTFPEDHLVRPDPFSVVDGFCERLRTDEILSDPPSRFNEFVLQRLERLGRKQTAIDPVGWLV